MSKKISNFLLPIFFCSLLSLGGIALAIAPAPRYSASEKRMLTDFPSISATGIFDGSVSEQFDHYATERAPFRRVCRHVWSATQLGLLQHESHGVVLCRDGSLSTRVTMDKDILARNLTALTLVRRAMGNTSLTLAVAPTRIEARCAVLPVSFHVQDSATHLPSEAVNFADFTQDTLWYRTDHHWTTEGAYLAYVRLSEVLGFTPYARESFTCEVVCENFLGSSAARAGFPLTQPDHIELWRYVGDETLLLTRNGTPVDFAGLYDLKKIDAGDPYAVFLGGNCGILEIQEGQTDTRPCLLVIRDSFASPILPFLARHYRIIAVDPRYGSPALSALTTRADAALVLCGMQTLCGEPFLTPLLKK